MALHDKFTASFEFLRRLLFHVRPYGLGKAGEGAVRTRSKGGLNFF